MGDFSMSSRQDFGPERAELEAVLGCEAFAKSPSLAKILRYVSEQYFEGRADTVKQYSIGVEALGRPPDFDPRQDPIIRVEAQRLRERLKRYYEAEGSTHSIVISLPVGHYIPQFTRRRVAPEPSAASDAVATPPSAASAGAAGRFWPSWSRSRFAVYSLLVFLAAVVLGAWAFSGSKLSRWTTGFIHQMTASASVSEDSHAIRILAGASKPFVDRLGRTWSADRYFSGGRAIVEPSVFIARASDPGLFRAAREGEFSYKIPLKPGSYEIHLYFAETRYGPRTAWGGGEVSRLFHIQMNGRRLFTDFDVYSDARGSDIADERVISDVRPKRDGYLHLDFIKAMDYPFVNAIAVLPDPSGKMRPIRIVAQDHNVADREGHIWGADRYVLRGRIAGVSPVVTSAASPALYAGEEYGNFDYAIPVPPGRYTVTLRFAETYYGPHNPGQGGVGSRIFNVYCNGVALLRNFDIFKAAGGENRPARETFHNLGPNAQGKLEFWFEPVKDYASVNSIEVVQQSR